MKEYKIVEISEGCVHLIPLIQGTPPHYIFFSQREVGHEYKLAIALGTHPDPLTSPEFYYESLKGEWKEFRVKILRQEENSWSVSTCCQSGCFNCPFVEQ